MAVFVTRSTTTRHRARRVADGGFGTMCRMVRLRALLRRCVVSVCAVLLLAAVLEAAARVWLHFVADEAAFRTYASIGELRARYGEFERFRAHRHLGFALAPGYAKGANRHNALGLRGDETTLAKPAGVLRVAMCGGSTTYGEGVDDYRLSAPYLLQQGLREDGFAVEVLNAGCPGWTTLETLINFETRLLDMAPDHVVVYHAINDVLPRMVWPHAAYRGDLSGWLCRDEHLASASLLESSTIARILLVASGQIEPHSSLLRILGDVPATSHSFTFRRQRKAGTYPSGIFREVPIEAMLAANPPVLFERNLRSLVGVARTAGVRVLLTTFAFSREFPGEVNIGHPAVQAAIEEANEIVRRLGAETGTAVLDLARQLTGRDLFTDGVHFTVAGNRRRAEILRRHYAAELR